MYDTIIERPLTQSHAVELSHMPDDATEGVAEHSFLGCNHQSTGMPQLQPLCSAALVPKKDEALG